MRREKRARMKRKAIPLVQTTSQHLDLAFAFSLTSLITPSGSLPPQTNQSHTLLTSSFPPFANPPPCVISKNKNGRKTEKEEGFETKCLTKLAKLGEREEEEVREPVTRECQWVERERRWEEREEGEGEEGGVREEEEEEEEGGGEGEEGRDFETRAANSDFSTHPRKSIPIGEGVQERKRKKKREDRIQTMLTEKILQPRH